MAQYVFAPDNVLAGPFETADEAMLEEVRLSRESAGQPRFPREFILPFVKRGEAIPFGHRFAIRKGRRVGEPETAPNRYFVLKQG